LALSDVEKEKDAVRNLPKPIVDGGKRRWSDKQKLEAVQTWLVLGNMSLTSRLIGIPEDTLRQWKGNTEWWGRAVAEIKLQERIELSHNLKKIVKAAHIQVEDRMVNGDVVMNQKTGELTRRPVALRDAHRVAVDLLNQAEAIEKATKGPEDTPEQDSNKLDILAERFAEFATMHLEKKLDKKQKMDVIDIEVKEYHAVHDEREEGLQEREREVQLSSGDNQEAL
jgi:transposase-like protein